MWVRTNRRLQRVGCVALVIAMVAAIAIALWRARSHDPILAALSSAIRDAQSIELHEGTRPHHLDRDPGSRSMPDASAIETVGYDELYREPTKWQDSDAAVLSALFREASTFEPVSLKKCIGFHADFAVEWKANGRSYFVMICFGCAELRVVTPIGSKEYD